MNKDILDQKHPSYDAKRWDELEALAEGGKKFHALISTFLPRNMMEPEGMYEQRKKRAKYHSYVGAIVNLYVAWLFAANFSVKSYKRGTKEAQQTNSFYGEFQEDVGGENTLTAFMKGRMRGAMTTKKSSWLIQLPDNAGDEPSSLDEYDRRGLGRATLTEIDSKELLDWECSEDGAYLWAIIRTSRCERKTPGASRNDEIVQWRVYDRENVSTYELRRDKRTLTEEAIKLVQAPAPHGFKRVPIVTLELPQELCVGEQTYDAQLAHFHYDAGLDWAIMRTCYAMPVFKIADDEKRPTMGTGYGLYLGVDEDMTWASPPSDAFDVIARNRDAKRDEIFRIVHQMAQGLDNNAETVGRSAESKEIDAAATRIMLNTYGEAVARAIEETYEIIGEARGDVDLEWSIEGFSGYDVATAGTLLDNVRRAKDLGIPSQTFQAEISTKAALSLVPESDQRVKDAIRTEIHGYQFEVTGQTVDAALADKQIQSSEKLAKDSLKSQEKLSKQKTAEAKRATPQRR
jgi:hypothetical protein